MKEPERSWWTVGDSCSQQLMEVVSLGHRREERMSGGGEWHGRRPSCGGSAEEVGSSPGPGAPGVTGDLSRHGQARRLRRSPWSHAADGVNDRRHFSLQTGREDCQRLFFRLFRPTRFFIYKNQIKHAIADSGTDAFERRRIITKGAWKKGSDQERRK